MCTISYKTCSQAPNNKKLNILVHTIYKLYIIGNPKKMSFNISFKIINIMCIF